MLELIVWCWIVLMNLLTFKITFTRTAAGMEADRSLCVQSYHGSSQENTVLIFLRSWLKALQRDNNFKEVLEVDKND